MGRGILSGVIWGAILSAILLGVASSITELPNSTVSAPEAGGINVPPGSQFNQERPDAAPVLPRTERRPAGDTAPLVSLPEAADALPPTPDTTPLGTPETGVGQTAALDAPLTGASPRLDPAREQAVLPTPETVRPALPGVDAAPEPALAIPAPEAGVGETAALDAPLTGGSPRFDLAREQAVLPTPETVQPALPGVDAAPAPAVAIPTPAAGEVSTRLAPPETPLHNDDPVPGGEEIVLPSPAALPPSAPAARSEADLALATLPPTRVPAAPSAEIGTPLPENEQPPMALPDMPDVLRLPASEIDAITPGAPADAPPRIGEPPAVIDDPDIPAIRRYAMPFERRDETPILSIVLLDTGATRPDPTTLSGFPVPLTVAIDPTTPDAVAAMQAYRAAGVEVVVLAPLPAGATPADVEVAFQSFMSTVPESVAVMDLPAAALQDGRPRASQVVAILAASGRGLITYDKGFNAALQIAERDGVPAGKVFRTFDDGTRDGAAMKRFLDQGAFRAGQDGIAIMVGMTRAETLAALAEWTLGSRAGSVVLAPVSAALQVN